MRLAGKTACLLFLLIFISPLNADPPLEELPAESNAESQEEELLFADWLFLEELFIFEGAFSFNEPFTDEETFSGEEVLLSEETSPDEEILVSEETFPDEESIPVETALLSEEIFLDEENASNEEILPNEETLLAEETDMDYDLLFVDAPALIFEVPTFEFRSFYDIFPNLTLSQRRLALSKDGLRRYFVNDESPAFIPNPDFGIDLFSNVMKKKPSHLIEALVVLPYKEKELDLLDIYNALGRIENLKDYSILLNGNDFYVFTESTRIVSDRNRRAISDPLPATMLPFSETMHLRLKEFSMGNLFIRADASISMYGITYSMTNFTDIRYFLVPIMRAERFITIIYLEPVKEGVLIYCMCGFYLPGFIADRVNLTPNINRRITIFVNWITDGLRQQENAAAN